MHYSICMFMPFWAHACPRHAVCCMPFMHVPMPDMPDMRAQVSARRFAARRCHPRRPGAGRRFRYCSLPCTTPPMHNASHLHPPLPACEFVCICPTPHALPAQLHPPQPRHICAVRNLTLCAPSGCRKIFCTSGGAFELCGTANAQVRTYFCAPIFIVPATAF